jgi:hypothetical protein
MFGSPMYWLWMKTTRFVSLFYVILSDGFSGFNPGLVTKASAPRPNSSIQDTKDQIGK